MSAHMKGLAMLTRVNQETISKLGCRRRPLENGLLQHISKDELRDQFKLFGGLLNAWARDKDVTFMPLMHGAGYAWQRLMPCMSADSRHEERVIVAQSYGDRQDQEMVRIYMDWINPAKDITNRHVVLIDDVLDSGYTMAEAVRRINLYNPAGVWPFFMLRKDRPRNVLVEPKWVMFDVDDCWLVGAGLDDAGKVRHLPYVAEKPRNGMGA